MASKKKENKKRLRRLKQQRLQKLRGLIGKDDQAFIKALIHLYPKIELSPYKKEFYKAVYREAIKALLNGDWQAAKDLSRNLPPSYPIISIIEAISLLSEGKIREAHVYLEALARGDNAEDFLPLITELDSLAKNTDLDRLNSAIGRALQGKNPRPRMSTQIAKDVWKLFRLLYRPERDGYVLPPSYWREMSRCISGLKARGMHSRLLDQAYKIVDMQRDIMSCPADDPAKIEEALWYWHKDIQILLIDGKKFLPRALEHLAQCVRLTCYRFLTGPEGTAQWEKFGDILIELLDVNEDDRKGLKETMERWSKWKSILRDRDLNQIRRLILKYKNSKGSTARERFLMDIAFYNLIPTDDDDDLFSEFIGYRKPDTKTYKAMGLETLEDAAATIADLPERYRHEAAQVVQTKVNEIEGISGRQIRRKIDLYMTLSEYLPKDGSLLIGAYAAMRLSNSLKVLSHRIKENLITKGKALYYDKLQETLLPLFRSTMEMRYSEEWREIIALVMLLIPEQGAKIEQRLASEVMDEWIAFNKIAARGPLADFFSIFSEFGLGPEIDKELSQLTDKLIKFGHAVFEGNPEIMALEILSALINIPQKRRPSFLNQRFNKASLSVKWRVAVYLGTLDMAGISKSSRLDLACHALYRILPVIPDGFGHWGEIISCVEDMGRSVSHRQYRQIRSLKQVLVKKLRDLEAGLDSPEGQAVIREYIDRIK